jgi:hypothetical protein
MGAIHSDDIFSWSSHIKELKNANSFESLMQNPYRSGSFQLGTEKGSKIDTFSENTVFYVSK